MKNPTTVDNDIQYEVHPEKVIFIEWHKFKVQFAVGLAKPVLHLTTSMEDTGAG